MKKTRLYALFIPSHKICIHKIIIAKPANIYNLKNDGLEKVSFIIC